MNDDDGPEQSTSGRSSYSAAMDLPTARPLVVLGMGSVTGDDRAALALVADLQARAPPGVVAIDGGVAPENVTGPVRRADPAAILVVDAVAFEGEPGERRRFGVDDLRRGSISTHSAPPTLLVDFLERTTDAPVTLLGIQPASLDGGLSVPVARSVADLARAISDRRCVTL